MCWPCDQALCSVISFMSFEPGWKLTRYKTSENSLMVKKAENRKLKGWDLNPQSFFFLFAAEHSCMCAQPLQSCRSLWDPMGCSPLGSSVHGTLQARILEWVAIPFSKGSSQPRDGTRISYISNGMFSSVQFSHSVVSDSLRPHGPQHARSPCLSPTPGVYSNSCPLS